MKMKKIEERTKGELKEEFCVFFREEQRQRGRAVLPGDWTATDNVILKQYVTRIHLRTRTSMGGKKGLIFRFQAPSFLIFHRCRIN